MWISEVHGEAYSVVVFRTGLIFSPMNYFQVYALSINANNLSFQSDESITSPTPRASGGGDDSGSTAGYPRGAGPHAQEPPGAGGTERGEGLDFMSCLSSAFWI